MDFNNLDFGIEVTADQWAELRKTAERRGKEDGFSEEGSDRGGDIRVFMDEAHGPTGWRDYLVADGRSYGAPEREVAEFHFNGGRPFATIELPRTIVDEPNVTEGEERTLRTELESWVRNRWHELMRASGIHFERGHIPQSGTVEREEFR